MSKRFYPQNSSEQQLRTTVEHLWKAIEALETGQTDSTSQVNKLTGIVGLGGSSTPSIPTPSNSTAASTMTERRVVYSGEAITVSADFCVIVVDYFEARDGSIEVVDSSILVET